MAWHSFITTSLLGRRVGLQTMSTTYTGTGASGRQPEFIVGAEDIRKESSTADSTGTYLKPYGISLLTTGLSADTTPVFRMDPPIPGVEKTIVWGSTTIMTMGSKIFVTNSTGGGAVFQTTSSSSNTCVASSVGNVMRLVGVTTALWAVVVGSTPSGFAYTTTT